VSEVTVGGHAFPAISAAVGQQPFWSVVVPVYNRTRYLGECLASVLEQCPGAAEMEVLVVDDASTEPLAALVARLGRGIARYHRNERNLGLPASWNEGLRLARGRWIHLLHDDDLVLPGFYARLGQALRECPESVGAAFTGYENIDEHGAVVFRSDPGQSERGIARNWLERVGVRNPLNMPAVVVRRATHERLGGYHPELTYTSDWELYKRIACFYDWWCEPEVLARYRVHADRKTAELFAAGLQAQSVRRAIEISESYLPAALCAQISAKSRRVYFAHCLRQAALLVKQGKREGAARLVDEAQRIDGSAAAQAELGEFLRRYPAVARSAPSADSTSPRLSEDS
jgi:glycosyltransferase involved in cell wall biosynthesis